MLLSKDKYYLLFWYICFILLLSSIFLDMQEARDDDDAGEDGGDGYDENNVSCYWKFDLYYMTEDVLRTFIISLDTKLVGVF